MPHCSGEGSQAPQNNLGPCYEQEPLPTQPLEGSLLAWPQVQPLNAKWALSRLTFVAALTPWGSASSDHLPSFTQSSLEGAEEV
jgi:hypothetical protein